MQPDMVRHYALQAIKREIADSLAKLQRLREARIELSSRKRTNTKQGSPARKRQTMSAAGRKAVSVRMKKYWAERRAAQRGSK